MPGLSAIPSITLYTNTPLPGRMMTLFYKPLPIVIPANYFPREIYSSYLKLFVCIKEILLKWLSILNQKELRTKDFKLKV
jgi:hypothetical protein